MLDFLLNFSENIPAQIWETLNSYYLIQKRKDLVNLTNINEKFLLKFCKNIPAQISKNLKILTN